jgi:hypothetical protein
MKQQNRATRRGFLLKATSALSAPIALAAAGGRASARPRIDAEATLVALEDERSIRALQLAYAERVNAASPTRAPADPSGALGDATIAALVVDLRDAVQVAPDRRTAKAVLRCEIVVETPIDAPGYSLVDLARLQGEGVLRRRETRALEQTFTRENGIWKIASTALKESTHA